MSNNDESRTVDGLVVNTSLILRAIRYYAVIGAGLGLLGVILLLQLGGDVGSSGGLLGGILLLVVLSFAVLSGPLIAAFIGYVTAESGSGGIKQRSMNSGIANAIGFAIFGIIVALILSAGLAFVIGGGGDNVASSGGGGTFELGNLITLIILMTIPNALVGGTITFFTEGQDKPRHSSSSTAEGAKTQENSGWERPNRSVIAILAVTVILMMSGGAVASGFVSPSNIIDGGEPSSSPDSGGTTNPPSEDESSSSPDSDGTTNPPSEDESSSSPDSGGTTDSTLDYPSTIQGEIRPDGPRDPEYGDLTATHSIQGDAGDSIEVTIQSTEFDTYLLVTGPAGEVVAEDDDDGDNTNSRAIFTLPSDGDYTIWVGSYSGDATGRYTLSVSGGTTDSTLDYPSTIQGEIRPDGPRDPEYGDLTATHSIQGDAGDSIEVTIQSTEFDTYLLVTGPAGEVVAEDDDDGDNTNSRAIFTLPSDGDYTIWVGSYSGDATGRYTLSVS